MFGRIQLYIFIGIVGFGILSGLYYSWRKGIEREALLEYNQAQIEQNIKDQEELKKKLTDIDKKQAEIEAANSADKKEFKDKMETINTAIDSKETVDRAASDVLKKTVTKLKDAPK
jgi:Tfp pilus assembly protein PilN